MENKTERDFAIFNQICTANDLDPQVIKDEADKDTADSLIRTAFWHRANALVADLNIDGSLTEGKEYNADGDPAAPSFTINEQYIREKYGADKAGKIIEALKGVQLPIQA
ncbi:hypothetical protein DXT99_26405 [Pontibacter diazotrophicus]|uniref:Uncharacterized protein n=1 Tax=Pontibacter diazotrophicus TaxID=1400979 RepID=A0A3D8KZ43_9BACT|nr:hypothetical protein [Pontibacter diazotrophicus]RDV10386.1 hypothetical protein DXT99_26405 [Pontibacter diazotrophicus]